MEKKIKIRDLRKSDQYKIDDEYLNGYARLCGVYATAVYNSLSRHANFQTQECFPSLETIASQHNISKRSVIRALRTLEEYGIIYIEKRKDTTTKRQIPNVYTLRDKTQWVKIDSRVTEIHSVEPSDSHDQSRVPEMHCKDTKIKDNKDKPKNDLYSLFEKEISSIPKNLEKQKEKFLSYWTEKNTGGKKERWQKEKVFDIKRRWNTWITNAKEWGDVKEEKKERIGVYAPSKEFQDFIESGSKVDKAGKKRFEEMKKGIL